MTQKEAVKVVEECLKKPKLTKAEELKFGKALLVLSGKK